MTQKNIVYHKSAKGAEAIASRQHGLGPKLRSLLIMTDGKRAFDELMRLSPLGDTEQLLGQLLDQGFIEPVPSKAAEPVPPTGSASAPAPLAAAKPPQSLAEAQRYVVRKLTDILGPNAEELCIRIESARNLHDFQVAVAKAEGMLRQFVSAKIAAEFMADAHAHMPAG